MTILVPKSSLSLASRKKDRLSEQERENWKRGWTMTVKLMMSLVVKGTWLHTGALWRLEGVQKVSGGRGGLYPGRGTYGRMYRFVVVLHVNGPVTGGTYTWGEGSL